jgi:hypothetical protein
MLDKDQKPVVKLAIEQTYAHVLRRALAITVFKGLEEIRTSMTIDSKRVLTNAQKLRIYNEQVQTDRAKTMLCFGLDRIVAHKHDLIDQVLMEYGLTLDAEELLFYHETMDKIIVHWADVIQTLIKRGNYSTIGRMLPMPKD